MTVVERITTVAIHAARLAGERAMETFRRPGMEVEIKTDFHDVVTAADRECEAVIRTTILERFPSSSIIGEEAGAIGTGDLVWYVDPIDGTANYARGLPMWTVSIAALIGGEVVSGVVYDPVADDLFWADMRGAFRNDARLSARGRDEPRDCLVIANFPSAHDLEHDHELALADFADLTREYSAVRSTHSSAISLCWVAAGWADATFSFATHPWDVAAGSFILRRAGGRYETYAGGNLQPIAQDHENPHYLALGATAHGDVLRGIMRSQTQRRGTAP